ncbi:MAG: hypothetical protein EZS28_006138 [Streblomastix strix]|uniref:Uncharacterized protein n=1 Tax=Streblomastix strix TaxID=222440 RepID=A0A5J4WTN1_9EUKA|nr:MAG: hypothetical protein EZS28_006138 [Streblomastix strix]
MQIAENKKHFIITREQTQVEQHSFQRRLPTDFVNSQNERKITFVQCIVPWKVKKYFYDLNLQNDPDTTPVEHRKISLHSTLVQEEQYNDYYVGMCDEQRTSKVFPQMNRRPMIYFWFKDQDGNELDVTHMDFTLELLLEF